ncbi:MAG: glycosyltransferase family 4 protein [Gemmatimonadaceae bacterium]
MAAHALSGDDRAPSALGVGSEDGEPGAVAHPPRRLLVLAPFAPRLDATHGGSRTIAQLIDALARRHRVALLYLRATAEPPVDDALRERCEIVEEVAHGRRGGPVRRTRRRLHLAVSLLRGRPMWATICKVEAYAARAAALAHTWRPDIVQMEFHVMGQYATALGGCLAPRVLVQHEPGALAARDRQRSQGDVATLLHRLDARAWERYEPAVMAGVHAVVVFTERDQQALAPLAPRTPVVRIPLGMIVPDRALDPLGHPPPSLLFVGSFAHPPNVDAAVRLAGAILPALLARHTDLVLYIVGADPPARVRGMAGEHVIVTGRVADVTPYLDRATLVVAPLRLGGGMRVKVLEALAAGKAVVATPLAVEGLSVTDGEQVALGETDRQLCDAIGALLDSPERRAALAARARAWAVANLGWERPVAAYETLYASLLDG